MIFDIKLYNYQKVKVKSISKNYRCIKETNDITINFFFFAF